MRILVGFVECLWVAWRLARHHWFILISFPLLVLFLQEFAEFISPRLFYSLLVNEPNSWLDQPIAEGSLFAGVYPVYFVEVTAVFLLYHTGLFLFIRHLLKKQLKLIMPEREPIAAFLSTETWRACGFLLLFYIWDLVVHMAWLLPAETSGPFFNYLHELTPTIISPWAIALGLVIAEQGSIRGSLAKAFQLTRPILIPAALLMSIPAALSYLLFMNWDPTAPFWLDLLRQLLPILFSGLIPVTLYFYVRPDFRLTEERLDEAFG